MASLDDIVTVQKNGVTALNNINQTNPKTVGQLTSVTVTAATVIVSGSGRLVNFSVVVAGAAGTIYNANALSPAASAALAAVPAVVGIYPAGLFFTNGLVVSPGSGQSVNVTYSIGQ